MGNRALISRSIALAGWIVGLAVTALGDYRMIPRLSAHAGGKPLAVAAGLAFGIVVMFVFVECTRRLAETANRQRSETPQSKVPKKYQTPIADLPPATRLAIILLVILVTLSTVFAGYPLDLIKDLFK